MIKGIAHICITTPDLAATERFYCSGLGLTKVFRFVKEDKEIGFYLKASQSSYIEVFGRGSEDQLAGAPIAHICFEVSDIEALGSRLKSEGYAVTEKLLGADQSWQMWATDPGGVRIEFHQYTDQSSQVTGQDCILG